MKNKKPEHNDAQNTSHPTFIHTYYQSPENGYTYHFNEFFDPNWNYPYPITHYPTYPLDDIKINEPKINETGINNSTVKKKKKLKWYEKLFGGKNTGLYSFIGCNNTNNHYANYIIS